MLFNSINFMIFFPIVVLVYFIIPKKIRYIWLLAASYYFYMSWNPQYALLIAFSTAVTWLSGLLLAKAQKKTGGGSDHQTKRKVIVALSFIINLSILFFFKYFDFILENINAVLETSGLHLIQNPFDIILPVGISFYTFQALSYTVDVYRGDVKAEPNILKYALFVSFFPQLVAGPIERSGNLLSQVSEVPLKKLWNWERITKGLIIMLWGLFMKMVIADRVAVLVDTVFNDYYAYKSTALFMAAIGFAIQIYCDFASYSTIAIGAAQVMGFNLMENFDTPYFARSIREFWHRWHISLSTWFRDYLYIPLGGNRRGKARKYFNTMVTFLASGLWHGANWTFVVWGGLHGAYQIIGAETKPLKDKINKRLGTKTQSIGYKIGQVALTFILVDIAWIFFRSDTIADAFNYIGRMFTYWDPWALSNDGIYTFGLDMHEMQILFFSVLALFVVSLIKYRKKKRLDDFLMEQPIWFRWTVLFVLIFAVFIYGKYGDADPSAFIYFQF